MVTMNMQFDGILNGKPVRRDWDYVSFEDYQKDTSEIVEASAYAISQMRIRAEQAERALAEVVLAARTTIKIHEINLHDQRRKVQLKIWRNIQDQTIEFSATAD